MTCDSEVSEIERGAVAFIQLQMPTAPGTFVTSEVYITRVLYDKRHDVLTLWAQG